MIISASRRSDIPAFHGDWFMEQLRRGEVAVRNPFRPAQAKTVSLKKQDVDAFVFWSRDPRPLLEHLPEIERGGYPYYFLLTLTGYPRLLESAAPLPEQALVFFKELAARIGRRRLVWRYDPVIFTDATPFAFHERNFSGLARLLSPYRFPGDRQFFRSLCQGKPPLEKDRGRGGKSGRQPGAAGRPAWPFCPGSRRGGAGNSKLRRSGL